MKIAICGLGLMGGSLAKALKSKTAHTVLGYDKDPAVLQQAVDCRAIDQAIHSEDFTLADITFVCLFSQATVDFLMQTSFKKNAVVADICGVKRYVVNAVDKILHQKRIRYVGTHPMAGREFSGFRYAKDDLFDRASMILTPVAGTTPETLTWLKDFFLTLGFRRVQFTTPQVHDEMIAYTSQLAHVVSSAYVKCPLAQKHRGFSAGSFADMTRVARLNEGMWTELFFDNKEALLPEISNLVENLAAYRDALANDDRETMRRLLREGREVKEKLEE